jgi:Cu(I)/Ag(I) efflux system membrane fusion protein
MNQSAGKTSLTVLLVVALAIVTFGLGVWVRGCTVTTESKGEAQGQIWTCAMHTYIRLPRPGKCPVCHMDLIPLETLEAKEPTGSSELVLSPQAQELAEILTAAVERKFVSANVRMVGKVDYDETRLGTITARVPGRLDRLYVDYTGIAVRMGDHLFSIYSPELLTAQEELLQALKTTKELEQSAPGSGALESARLTLGAVRDKLRLWDLTGEQIAEIEKRGTATDHLTIYAPLGGIVITKHAVEGTYVQTGMPVYTIADLSQVWVKLDAYESDVEFVRYAQHVTFETESYPGEAFEGTVAFIDPVLDEKTRTVKVRVNVANPQGKLKPGMFVHGILRAQLAAGGKVVDRALAGKWICPMHPDILKDEPGTCDICGMALVGAETLGYASSEGEVTAPLVVPASAPLITGKRAIVYVAVAGKKGTYKGREIVLGPRAGGYYVVDSGLAEGEQVVVNGNLKIDSAIQLRAQPSMMQPGLVSTQESAGQTPERPPTALAKVPDEFKAALDPVYAAYFAAQDALSKDDVAKAKAGADALVKALDAVDASSLKEAAAAAWHDDAAALAKSAGELSAAEDLTKAREALAPLSDAVYRVAKRFGASGAQTIWRFHCPMAFDGAGAYWLQDHEDVANPYFGSVMLGCNDAKEGVVSAATKHEDDEHE